MARYDKILIASAKGGVGKSTTAIGLALAFAERGRRVLLVDCDAYSRSLDLLCGRESSVLYNLGDVILGRVEPARAIAPVDLAEAAGTGAHRGGAQEPGTHRKGLGTHRRGAQEPGTQEAESREKEFRLFLCTAPYLFQDAEMFEKEGRHINDLMGMGVKRLLTAASYDMVILDTSSGGGLSCAAGLTDEIAMAIVTSEQSKTSIRAAEYTASQLEKIGISNQRLVVCGFDVSSAARGRRAGVIEMIDGSTLKCVGIVPYDERLILRQESGLLPDRRCVSTLAYRNIAARLSGESVPVFAGMGRYRRKRGRVL